MYNPPIVGKRDAIVVPGSAPHDGRVQGTLQLNLINAFDVSSTRGEFGIVFNSLTKPSLPISR